MVMRSRRTVGFIEPCLPCSAKLPPTGSGWIHEIKHDGFRIMARRDAAGVRLITRKGNDFTARFPFITMAVAALPAANVLDRWRGYCMCRKTADDRNNIVEPQPRGHRQSRLPDRRRRTIRPRWAACLTAFASSVPLHRLVLLRRDRTMGPFIQIDGQYSGAFNDDSPAKPLRASRATASASSAPDHPQKNDDNLPVAAQVALPSLDETYRLLRRSQA
jgi:hypothetical protein